jgi:hypothetical protein
MQKVKTVSHIHHVHEVRLIYDTLYEADMYVSKAKKCLRIIEDGDFHPTIKERASMRRASLDLTRSLAVLRKNRGF